MTHDEQDYRDSLRASDIPGYMHDGIVFYLMLGIPPGSFLTAVMENDLREAVGRADDTNSALLTEYVRWFYNHAPSTSWGSHKAVTDWIIARREEANQNAEAK